MLAREVLESQRPGLGRGEEGPAHGYKDVLLRFTELGGLVERIPRGSSGTDLSIAATPIPRLNSPSAWSCSAPSPAPDPRFIIKFQVADILNQSHPEFQTLLFFNLNLLQENVGACDVFKADVVLLFQAHEVCSFAFVIVVEDNAKATGVIVISGALLDGVAPLDIAFPD